MRRQITDDLERNLMTPRPATGAPEGGQRRRPALLGAALLTVACLALTATTTDAAYQDETHAAAELRTDTIAAVLPSSQTYTAASAAFLVGGELYISGYRGTGVAGNGTVTVPAASAPTRVDLPVDVVKVVGGTNDFHWGQNANTWFAALGADGVVYTWGSAWGGFVSGDGPSPRAITTFSSGGAALPMPQIVDVQGSENQVYALDAEGTMYVWGYAGENLPRPESASSTSVPVVANVVTTQTGAGVCAAAPGGVVTPNGSSRPVTWHAVYGGNNSSFGVSREGLVYSWGYDYSGGLPTEFSNWNQRCPRLVAGANQVLFEQYPELYTTADGRTLSPGAPDYDTVYADIVAHLQDPATPDVCAGEPDPSTLYDATGCPVRQMGTGARAFRMVLQNHQMYTWASSTADFGWPTLGRWVSSTAATAGGAVPGLVTTSQDGPSIPVDFFVAGSSSVVALTTEGTVYGWGANNFCQAIGAHSSGGTYNPDAGPCAVQNGSAGTSQGLRGASAVWYPTPVVGLPDQVRMTDLASTTCSTWVQDERRNIYGFGGGTIVGSDFRSCVNQSGLGYRLHDYNSATPENPFGTPVTVASTATTQLSGTPVVAP